MLRRARARQARARRVIGPRTAAAPQIRFVQSNIRKNARSAFITGASVQTRRLAHRLDIFREGSRCPRSRALDAIDVQEVIDPFNRFARCGTATAGTRPIPPYLSTSRSYGRAFENAPGIIGKLVIAYCEPGPMEGPVVGIRLKICRACRETLDLRSDRGRVASPLLFKQILHVYVCADSVFFL